MARYDYPDPPRIPIANTGDWYRQQDLKARHWGEQLDKAKAAGRPAAELRWLEERLEEARYVGD